MRKGRFAGGRARGIGLVALLLAAGVLGNAARAAGASLYFSPASKTVGLNNHFTVGVYVSSADQALNAVSGNISFPVGKLEVVSLSKENSIINLWVQDPSFLNSDGTVVFEGVVLNPGFTGAKGKILSITFRPRAAGKAAVSFSKGSVLANDGQGTNILGGMEGASFSIRPMPPGGAPAAQGLPPLPVLQSPTHPDENRWYNAKTFEADWTAPSGVDGASYALNQDPSFIPSSQKTNAGSVSWNLTQYGDGVWYFHVRFHNGNGWGPTAHRMVKIGFSPPTPPVIERKVSDTDPTNPQPAFEWRSTGRESGVTYRVKIGDGDLIDASTLVRASYVLPLQAPGTHSLLVRALDEAGNFSEATTSFTVEPIAAPTVTSYSARVRSPSEALVVSGSALPGVTVVIHARKTGGLITFLTTADGQGRWSASYGDRINPGTWELTARAVDARGALSNETPGVAVEVNGWLPEVLQFITEWGMLVAVIVVVAGALGALFYLVLQRVGRVRARLKRELRQFKAELQRDLKKLNKDLGGAETKRKVDLSPAAVQEHREEIKEEISHLKKDIKEEIKKIDEMGS